MRLPIYIYGAGGLGREFLSLLKSFPDWEPTGFFDDGLTPGSTVKGIRVVGGFERIEQLSKPIHLALAIGDPLIKQRLHQKLKVLPGISFPVFIHPQAILQDKESIQLGAGTIVTAGCILTNDIRLGDHVLINLNCTIGHDATIGDYTSVMPGVNLAGNVSVGQSVLIGSGANVLNGVSLGSRCRVGTGAVVTKDVPPDVVVVGIPAKVK